MPLQPQDRLKALLEHPTLNGIDFIEVANTAQTLLNVHFLNANPLQGTVSGATITGGETIRTVAVLPFTDADWSLADGRPLLTLHVSQPGDFSNYTLTLTSFPLPITTPQLDPYYSQATFSFKAGCPSDLDCAAPCPPAPLQLPTRRP